MNLAALVANPRVPGRPFGVGTAESIVIAFIIFIILIILRKVASGDASRTMVKKKKSPERPPERPIEITKLIDEYAEEGRLPLSFGGKYLPKQSEGTAAIKLDTRAISPIRKPTCEKEKEEEEDQLEELEE